MKKICFHSSIFLSLGDKLNELCKLIIGSLDEQGFFKSTLGDLAVIAGVEIEEMQKALEIVKRLDPPGVGAKDVKESLLLQLRRKRVLKKRYMRSL